MPVQVHRTNDELRFSWPLGPRLLRYVPILVGPVVWCSLAFAVSTYVGLTPMLAVGLGLVPSIVMLAVVVPHLVAELNRRTIVLYRRGSQIAIGAAGPFDPEQFSIATSQVKRWGRLVPIVTLSVRTVAIKTAVEMEILYEQLGSVPEAEELTLHIREFLNGSTTKAGSSARES
jgi:hypothetical protein